MFNYFPARQGYSWRLQNSKRPEMEADGEGEIAEERERDRKRRERESLN